MDDFERAAELEMMDRDIAIAQARRAAADGGALGGAVASGACLWCEELVADGVRWCSAECRDWWDWAERRGKR